MRSLLVVMAALVCLQGCTSTPALPEPQKGKAWINLYAQPGYMLTAQSVDRVAVNDGRYFQITPGERRVEVRFQFDSGIGGGLSSYDGGGLRTCMLAVKYPFEADKRYLIRVRPVAGKGQGWLYDDQNQVLSAMPDVRCGPY